MSEAVPLAAVEAAVAEAGPALPVRGCVAEQLDLLPADRRVTCHDIDALPRGRGRPRGSKNRRTEAWRDYLASRYTHPLETLAAIQSTPVDVLASQLGCRPIEALSVIKSAAAELAPYMEGKMPVAVDLTARGDFRLVLGKIDGAGEAGPEGARELKLLPTIVEPEFEENQGLSDSDGEPLE